MPVLNEDDAADDSDRQQRCSCLPFCFWGAAGRRPNKSGGSAQAKRRRRRRLRLSWLAAWPWFRKSGGKGDAGDGSEKGVKKRRRGGRRLLLLLTTSLQPKKALASVVSGDSSALLPVPAAKVSSYGDAKKQSNRRPRRPTVDDDAASSGSRQPQVSATASTGSAMAHARPRPATTTTSQAPSPRPADDGPAGAGRTWRAPSTSSRRQRHSLRQPGDCGSSGCGLWTAATTLGVIVLLGRVAAVVFLCSCLYGARFVRAWAAGGASAKAQPRSGGVDDGVSSTSSSRRFGDSVGVVAAGDKVVARMCATEEECKKKVVMAGLLDRAGKTPSSRFGR